MWKDMGRYVNADAYYGVTRYGIRSLAIDVLQAEGGGLASAVHELVEGVDTLHILHDAEGEVSSYPGGTFHEVDRGGHEVLYLLLGALSATIEVLARELSRHDG